MELCYKTLVFSEFILYHFLFHIFPNMKQWNKTEPMDFLIGCGYTSNSNAISNVNSNVENPPDEGSDVADTKNKEVESNDKDNEFIYKSVSKISVENISTIEQYLLGLHPQSPVHYTNKIGLKITPISSDNFNKAHILSFI